MNRSPLFLLSCVLILSFGLLVGCAQGPDADTATNASTATPPGITYADAVVWAVNVGGEAYEGVDGVAYLADEDLVQGTAATIDTTLGSQDGLLYRTYRTGDLAVAHPLPDGFYDVTFHFSEPEDEPVGSRVFLVRAEDALVIDSLDVRKARDEKHHSALTRTAQNVQVTDGQLDIAFEPVVSEPILSAIVVRQRQQDQRTWTLAWEDNFDGVGAPDSTRWSYNVWPARKVNDEDQAYTDRLKNVRQEDGVLVIEAHKEQYDNAEYTSGRIHTEGKGDLLYGRVEVSARVPAGQGTWAAVWMLPTDPYRYATTCEAPDDWQGSPTCDAWPNSGEIDILEHVGYDMNHVHGTVHNKAYYWRNWEQRKGSIETVDAEGDFHVYALEWTPERIDIFFDGTRYFTYMNEGTGWRAWPYDHPYNIILNLAVGGAWGRAGGPIDDSIFPVRMEVDYVRVYESADIMPDDVAALDTARR
ncbi:MAG: family 16 glycosylhydrolase [Bacteroidota bacterium]